MSAAHFEGPWSTLSFLTRLDRLAVPTCSAEYAIMDGLNDMFWPNGWLHFRKLWRHPLLDLFGSQMQHGTSGAGQGGMLFMAGIFGRCIEEHPG